VTHDEVKKRVQDIRDAKGDAEIAHRMEDVLYFDFVHYVASQEGPHRVAAEEVLKTAKIKFPRHCA
jgi:hypothetical protein